MGYTHYWRCNPEEIKKHPSYRACVNDMAKVINNDHGIPLEVGPSNHYDIFINGVDSDSHETFVFPPKDSFDFCKTAYKPYDTIVTACLAIAKHHFGDMIKVSSDGGPQDWVKGVNLAANTLNLDIAIPLNQSDEDDY